METTNEMGLQGLYGSTINPSRAIGYCEFHNCYLTVATLKRHECLSKECDSLKKEENHSYWRQREVLKARKKEKRGGVNVSA